MSNEEQVADTIEMLYERLNSYNKQDLFNYGYLLESNEILCKDIEEKDKEIERLNNDIKELLKENSNKEKVIKAQDNIIKEVRECINHYAIENEDYSKIYNNEEKELLEILDKADKDV